MELVLRNETSTTKWNLSFKMELVLSIGTVYFQTGNALPLNKLGCAYHRVSCIPVGGNITCAFPYDFLSVCFTIVTYLSCPVWVYLQWNLSIKDTLGPYF